jgi:hypothetical protein
MGLDITAYSRLKPAPDAEVNEDGYPVNWGDFVQIRENPDFPGRAKGLTNRAIYKVGESFGFRAGSYSGYNEWRSQLADLTGKPEATYRLDSKGPFAELICFSDCEGVIGPEVSKKLAKDFADWEDRARKSGDEYFFSKYQEWKRAFEMASQNGAVDFH